MSRVRLSAVVLVLFAGSVAVAKDRPRQYAYRPVSISFVPGLSTNGLESRFVSSAFSLNIIGGSIGRVRGAELGGVFNIDEDEVLGYQAAGVFNTVDGGFGGVQQAGVFSIVGGSFGGVQQAAVINVVGNGFDGTQMAGVVNVVGGSFTGAQIAGVANVVGDGFTGAQLSGVVNVAGERMSGAQLAGVVNVADEFSGAQIGLVNIAGESHGLQLGLVNIAEKADVPIGLVSIVENGMFHVNAWATEFAPVNVGIKTGSNTIYNVFMVGWQPDGESTRLYGGLGIGGHIPLNRFFVDIDLLSHGVWTGPDWFPEGGSDLLSSLRLTGGWQVTDMLAITAGPTLNVWVSEREDGSSVPFYDAPLYQWHGSEHVRIWPGLTMGLQLL
ncbi:MAG: hypothetical protein NTX53_02045 [candidate division WOR-3 bacterium]|nr:hypothetical protein [candidate division WOR-3 bacterium]